MFEVRASELRNTQEINLTSRPLELPTQRNKIGVDNLIANTVDFLPLITQKSIQEQKKETLDRIAIMAILSEKIPGSILQTEILPLLFIEKPACLTVFDWLIQLNNQTITKFYKQRKKTLSKSTNYYFKILKEKTPQIEKYLNENPFELSFGQIVGKEIMQPITAAYFFLLTRPCEHVVLNDTVIGWANSVPDVSQSPVSIKETPTSPIKYIQAEYRVRRQQRVYLPGLTALEAHLVIHNEGLCYTLLQSHLKN